MRLSRKLLALPNLDSHLRGAGDRKEKPPGHPPGMLVHAGERRADRVSIRAMAYDADSAEEVETEDPEQCLRFAGTRGITWIQVAGLHDPEPIRKLGQAFRIHPLIQENASSLRDFYLSEASKRMNGIMKVLTCFSAIFLPLTFLAGVYGMNFARMPELGLAWAYPALWGIFALISAAMFLFFRKKDWL